VALGLAGSAVPDFDLATLRIPGILQLIGVTYAMGALLLLHAGVRARIWTAAAILLAHWGFLTLVPVPGSGTLGLHTLDRPAATLPAWVD
jgi:predicted acyltransferase